MPHAVRDGRRETTRSLDLSHSPVARVSAPEVQRVVPSLSIQLRTFGAQAPVDWRVVLDQAVAADRAGIAKVVVSDHIAFGNGLDAYADPALGGTAGGRQPTGPDGQWLEPLTVLSVIAGMTSRVRLGTNILLAALRRPAVLAKSVATLDVLSGGRVDLGVGVGWQRAEYDVCGLDFEDRGRLLDHTLEVCEALWTDDVVTYSSAELTFEQIHAMPKPVQPAGIPIWVSGTVNNRSMQRLARFGTGWIPWGPDALDVPAGIARMRDALAALGRDPFDIQVVGALPIVRRDAGVDLDASMAQLAPLLEAGVTDVRAHLAFPEDLDAATEAFTDVVDRFRAATA
jgi:probable F420-dependent oxidoreductase